MGIIRLSEVRVSGHHLPRGYRAARTNLAIDVFNANDDYFHDYTYQVTLIWDSPRASIVRHRYVQADPRMSLTLGQVFLENVMVPTTGQLELVAVHRRGIGLFFLTRDLNHAGAIVGRCACTGRRRRTLRFEARQVGVSDSQTVSAGSTDQSGGANTVGGSASHGGVGLNLSVSENQARGRNRGRSRTIGQSLGLGRFRITQQA